MPFEADIPHQLLVTCCKKRRHIQWETWNKHHWWLGCFRHLTTSTDYSTADMHTQKPAVCPLHHCWHKDIPLLA